MKKQITALMLMNKLKQLKMNIGNQLPSDYKDFLKEYGGCYLESKKITDQI